MIRTPDIATTARAQDYSERLITCPRGPRDGQGISPIQKNCEKSNRMNEAAENFSLTAQIHTRPFEEPRPKSSPTLASLAHPFRCLILYTSPRWGAPAMLKSERAAHALRLAEYTIHPTLLRLLRVGTCSQSLQVAISHTNTPYRTRTNQLHPPNLIGKLRSPFRHVCARG